jgi:hypothetical protein
MSTQIGTASDYLDMLEKLDTFLTATGHAWGKKFTGTGTGDLTAYIGTSTSVAETFTITATSATNFTVVGSVTGALADATVGTPYTSAKIDFTLTAGGTAYVAGDVWTINTAPKWTRLARWGCADTRKWTTSLSEPIKMIDGSVGSGNISTVGTTTSAVEWEMVAATAVRRVFMQAPDATPSRMPTSVVLQWKDNPGDAWTTAQTFTKGSWSTSEGAMFQTTSDPGAHKYWKLDMSGATTSTAIGEIYLYRDLTGTITCNQRAEWVWESPGLDGARPSYICMRTAHNQPADIFNVGLIGFRSWDSTQLTTAQPGVSYSGNVKGFLSTSSPSGYWFVVNGQRLIVVMKIGTIYQICYMGFGFSYEPPSVHPYPMIVAGTYQNASSRYSITPSEFRNPTDPGPYSMAVYYPDSSWREHSNRFSSGTEGTIDDGAGREGKVWPSNYASGTISINYFKENIDGSRSLFPCVLYNTSPRHTWGEIDGLYWTTGFGLTSETIIREDRFDHLVVPNIFRTGAKDYGAVRLD